MQNFLKTTHCALKSHHNHHSRESELSKQGQIFALGCLWQTSLKSNPVDLPSKLHFMTQGRKRRHHSHHCSPDSTCFHFLFKGTTPWSHYEALKHHKRQVVIRLETAPFPGNCPWHISCPYDVCVELLSCPVSHYRAVVSAVVYIGANGRLPDAKGLTVYQCKRVVNMGTQPPSWPWYQTIHHPGLEKGWGWEEYPDGGHLAQVRLCVS